MVEIIAARCQPPCQPWERAHTVVLVRHVLDVSSRIAPSDLIPGSAALVDCTVRLSVCVRSTNQKDGASTCVPQCRSNFPELWVELASGCGLQEKLRVCGLIFGGQTAVAVTLPMLDLVNLPSKNPDVAMRSQSLVRHDKGSRILLSGDPRHNDELHVYQLIALLPTVPDFRLRCYQR